MTRGQLIENVEMASSTLRAWTVKDVKLHPEEAHDVLMACADRFAYLAEKLRALQSGDTP